MEITSKATQRNTATSHDQKVDRNKVTVSADVRSHVLESTSPNGDEAVFIRFVQVCDGVNMPELGECNTLPTQAGRNRTLRK